MIRDLCALYVAIKDDEVIFFSTNLKSFVKGLKEKYPNVKSYEYYRTRFKKEKIIQLEIGRKETCILQEVYKKF